MHTASVLHVVVVVEERERERGRNVYMIFVLRSDLVRLPIMYGGYVCMFASSLSFSQFVVYSL